MRWQAVCGGCGVGASAVKRTVASLFAIGIILGMTGRGPSSRVARGRDEPSATARPGVSSGFKRSAQTVNPRLPPCEPRRSSGSKPSGAAATPDTAPVASAPAATKADAPAPSAALSHRFQPITSLKSPQQKLLQDRLHWLDEHAKLALALKKATSPESSPEHQADQLKGRAEAVRSDDGPGRPRTPKRSCPPRFSRAPARRPAVLAAEMKDAIDATTHELGEWKNKAETLKSGKAEREAVKKKNAAERDKVFQLVTTLKARDARIREGGDRRPAP